MNPLLKFEGVSRCFTSDGGLRTVLQDVNVSIYADEFSAITGPSGSGKSTFLNLCALLDEPSSGEIYFSGKPTSDMSEDTLNALRKEAVGMVFQHYCLLPYRTVLENVLFRFRYLDIARSTIRDRARTALEMVGMLDLEDRPTHLLSGGEMQRVGIARAIALKPRLLVADEPTGNLDKQSTEQVMQCLTELRGVDGMAIMLVTHDESLLRYASRHLCCNNGVLHERH